MTFFISAQPSNVRFQIQRERLPNLAAAQTLAIEVEDDLFGSRKWSRDLQKGKGQKALVITIDPLYQKLANDLIQLKKQFPYNPPPLYQDIPRRNYVQYQQNRQTK